MSSSPRVPHPRQGSQTSTKQMVRTVVDGKRITISTAVGEISGYLAGMDDYHWLIIQPSGQVALVHKNAALIITLGAAGDYAREPARGSLESVVAPFRTFVHQRYFGRSRPQDSAISTEEYAPC